ncbi:cytochrome P450 [Pelagimonas varians]|uniref:Cytochrome P450 120 n=1 Tax=Pelagimonas varians TaxID=696760 RepID=A0A238L6C1_9RHOB|nr:cytochrome P450 [Pelagimonas varians]PYG25010.1 cytochrome P450 [Pelagimonas varians]SMX50663.1 Putative cytochrome P450 120 [Pelagimonas varians]
MSIFTPKLDLRPASEMRWTTVADIIRLREDTRPSELLSQGVVHTMIGERDVFFISDPEAIAVILKRDSASFPKAAVQQRLGYHAFGPSISGTINETNRRQRKALAPLFGGSVLRKVIPIGLEAAQETAKLYARTDEIDLSRLARRLALDITWSLFLGPGHYTPPSPKVELIFDRLLDLPKDQGIAQATVLKDLVDELIRSDRFATIPKENPVSQITCPKGLGGDAPLSQAEIYANAVNLAWAGFATTGTCLAWGLWVLGQDVELQDKMRRELCQGVSISDTLHALYSEVMRLWPPAPDALRLATRELIVEDYKIAPGSMIMVCPYALHRRRDIWPDPDRFDVSRFLKTDRPRSPHQMIWPFSGGTSRCMGQAFAWKELVTATEVLIRECRIVVQPETAAQVGLKPGVLIDPDRPLMAQLERIA